MKKFLTALLIGAFVFGVCSVNIQAANNQPPSPPVDANGNPLPPPDGNAHGNGQPPSPPVDANGNPLPPPDGNAHGQKS